MTEDEAKTVCAGQTQGAITPRREPVAWVLWHDGHGPLKLISVYLNKARAEADLALLSEHTSVGKYHLTEVPRFGP